MSNYFWVKPVTHHFAHTSILIGEFKLENRVFNSNSLVYRRVHKMECVIKTTLNFNPTHFPKLTLSIGFEGNMRFPIPKRAQREREHWIIFFFWLDYFVPFIEQYDI